LADGSSSGGADSNEPATARDTGRRDARPRAAAREERSVTAAIQTRGLTKSYGERRGVFDLDLEVTEGEIFGFLGPNGAGKTTTIRLLLDLIRPDRGGAAVFGHDCRTEATAVHRLVGYLPGEFTLDAKLTGRQLVTYLGNLHGGVDWTDVDRLAHAVDLDLDRPFGQYSRGNKQKVGLVQAFMNHPRLLILDEPTGGLDPLNQEAVLDLVRRAHADGATVFFSSHVLSEVEVVCQRVGFIRDGELIRMGPVRELLAVRGHSVEAECERVPDAAALAALDGVANVAVDGNVATCFVRGEMGPLVRLLDDWGVRRLESREPSLTEVFIGLYEGDGGEGAQQPAAGA
jgi:ABC-2 type transport system ATP-binding protein